jgi:hypothetical protein
VSDKAVVYGEALVPETGAVLVAGVVAGALASGVGTGVVGVEPGEVVDVPVGVGRDFAGAGVFADFVGVLLWDGDGECVRGRSGAVVRCVNWLPVFSRGAVAGAGRTQRYSTNTPANSNSRIQVERRVRLSSDRSGRHISSTPSPAPSRRSWSR